MKPNSHEIPLIVQITAGTMMPYGTCQLHPGPYTPAELETIERRLAERAERRASEHAHSE